LHFVNPLSADADKQQAMNLFLGIFSPQLEKHKIWELPSDYYLHHNTTWDLKASKKRKRLDKWQSCLDVNIKKKLPFFLRL